MKKRSIARQGAALKELSDRVRQMQEDIKPLIDLNERFKEFKENQAGKFGLRSSFSSRKGTKDMSTAELKAFILSGQA